MLKEGMKASHVAKSLGVTGHTVHNRMFALRNQGLVPKGGQAVVRAAQNATVAASAEKDAAIAITIRPEDTVEIKLRSPDLQGTLLISKHGVSYMRPHQKTKPDKALPFEMIAKILETGLFS